ncbi:MAG: hypothetical protein V4646_06440 [Pseudomonadota bacterium]
MNKTFVFAKLVKLLKGPWLLIALALAFLLMPAWVAAQGGMGSSSGSGASAGNASSKKLLNPLSRNPGRRSGIPDTAPVPDDPRNSSTRPTLPAAPVTPDPRDVVPPQPDGSRDLK